MQVEPFNLEHASFVVSILTLIGLAVYTYYTWQIFHESKQLRVDAKQPFMTFLPETEKPFIAKNVGSGPALNIMFLHGTKAGRFFMLEQENVAGAAGVGETGSFDKEKTVEVTKDKICHMSSL